MNKLMIIGNLTKDPEIRTTSTGKNVCTFTVAVNRRKKLEGQPDADYFRVSAWDQMGENCQRFLNKGKKVCVIGRVSVRTYKANDGETRASLEVLADDVEFVSAKKEDEAQPVAEKKDQQSGFVAVETDELPFE